VPVSCPLYWSASGAALLEAAASFISTSPLLPFDAAAAAGASALPSLLAWHSKGRTHFSPQMQAAT
jgi:hypothetical protein